MANVKFSKYVGHDQGPKFWYYQKGNITLLYLYSRLHSIPKYSVILFRRLNRFDILANIAFPSFLNRKFARGIQYFLSLRF